MMKRLKQTYERADKLILLVVLLSLLAAWPFILRSSLPRATDTELHVFRAAQMGAIFRGGDMNVRWAPDLFYGYGYPIFNYYAPFIYYFANLLTMGIEGGTVFGIKLVFITGFLLGGLGTFGSVRNLFGDDRKALLGAVLFLTSPYVYLIDPHIRGVVPEFFAMTSAPAALWALTSYIRKPDRLNLTAGALLTAAILSSHNLLGPMLFALLAGFTLWDSLITPLILKEKIRGKRLIEIFKPLFCGLLIASAFWIPLLLESDLVRLSNLISDAGHFDYHNHFVSLRELLSPNIGLDLGAANPAYHYNLGLIQWVFAIAGILFTAIIRKNQRAFSRNLFFGFVGLFVIFMITPASVIIWEMVRQLAYIQFPWRMLGPLALILALLGSQAAGLLDLLPTGKPRDYGFGVLLIAASISVLPILTPPDWGEFGPTSVTAINEFEFNGGAPGTTSTGDYIPRTVEADVQSDAYLHDQYQRGGMISRIDVESLPAGVTIRQIEDRPLSDTYLIETDEKFTLTYLTFYFPGWEATLDGQPKKIWPTPFTGFIQATIPGGTHELTLSFGSTAPRALGSFLSLVGLTLLIIFNQHLQKPGKNERGLDDRVSLIGAAAIGISLLIAIISVITNLFQPISDMGQPIVAEDLYFVHFEGGIDLLGYDLPQSEMVPGETINLRIYWQAREPVPRTFQTFLHMASSPIDVWASQSKLHPADFPTTRWPIGKYVIDEYEITIPYGTPPGEYDLNIGLWNLNTGYRQLTLLPDGTPTGEYATLPVKMTVLPADSQPLLEALDMYRSRETLLTNEVTMLGYSVDPENPIGSFTGYLVFDVRWQTLTDSPSPGEIVIRVVDGNGVEILREYNEPAEGRYPFPLWSEGEIVRDLYAIWIDDEMPRGLYRVELGYVPDAGLEPENWVYLGLFELAE